MLQKQDYYWAIFFSFNSFVDMQYFWSKFLLAEYFDLIIILSSTLKY